MFTLPHKMFNSRRNGQSLLEAVVALGVLTTVLLGVSPLLSRSFLLNRVNTDETTGTYLAAEGIEITKNILDHDYYTGAADPGASWGTCGGTCTANGLYRMDYASAIATPILSGACDASDDPYLYFSTTTKLYSYSSVNAATTTFQRCITISHTRYGGGRISEVTVDSMVTWSAGPLAAQSVDLEDHFYNWRP